MSGPLMTVASSNNDELTPERDGSYRTATHAARSVGVASSEVLAANANRLYALFINDSDAAIYLKVDGAAAALNAGIRLAANGGSYEMSRRIGNLCSGKVTAISSGAAKNLLVTEGV